MFERLDVTSMVLVEVGEPVVQEHGGTDVVGDVKSQRADVGRHRHSRSIGDVGGVALPSRRSTTAVVGRFEGGLDLARRHDRKGIDPIPFGCLTDAVGIVENDLLDLADGEHADRSNRGMSGPGQVRPVATLRTCALAHKSRPPMGANMRPTMKKRGRTVFGVRIGLRASEVGQHGYPSPPLIGCLMKEGGGTYCQAFNLCCRKAVSMAFTLAPSRGLVLWNQGVERTCGSPAFDLGGPFMLWILRVDRVRLDHLLSL